MSNAYYDYYNQLAIIMGCVSLFMIVMAVVLWFKLDIKHYFSVLTGSDARKQIDRIRNDAMQGAVQGNLRMRRNSVIAWNTSGDLDRRSLDKRMMPDDGTSLLAGSLVNIQHEKERSGGLNFGTRKNHSGGTTLLNQQQNPGNLMQGAGTTVLSQNQINAGMQMQSQGTTVLGQNQINAGVQMQGAGTTVLGQNQINSGNQMNADPYATTVLNLISNMERDKVAPNVSYEGFVVEREANSRNN